MEMRRVEPALVLVFAVCACAARGCSTSSTTTTTTTELRVAWVGAPKSIAQVRRLGPCRSTPLRDVVQTGNIVSFGNRKDIHILLPTTNVKLAEGFLEQPQRILFATWDQNMVFAVRGEPDLYQLKFPAISITVATITPSVYVYVRNINGDVQLQSSRLEFDSTRELFGEAFLRSFQLQLDGELKIQTIGSNVCFVGHSTYNVSATLPKFLAVAPKGVLNLLIRQVSSRVEEFGAEAFTRRLQKDFRMYMMAQKT